MKNNITFFKNNGSVSLDFLVSHVNGVLYLSGQEMSLEAVKDIEVKDVATLRNASKDDLTFLSNNKYKEDLLSTKAGFCVLENRVFDESLKNKIPKSIYIILVSNAYASFARLSSLFYPRESSDSSEVSDSAFVSKSATLGKNCRVMANSYIGNNVKIGDDVIIYPNVVIGDNVVISDNAIIYDSVSLKCCLIGKYTIIHSGARIGQDGFGIAADGPEYIKVPQIGRVIVGDHVEIGANSTIDRGTLEDTIIGDMTKIDNLVQIGHNVNIGKGCLLVSQVGIAGSTKVGNYVVLGGQVGVAGHLTVGDQVQAGAQAGIIKDVAAKEVVWGTPSVPIKVKMREITMLKKMVRKRDVR